MYFEEILSTKQSDLDSPFNLFDPTTMYDTVHIVRTSLSQTLSHRNCYIKNGRLQQIAGNSMSFLFLK
jgi:hypothetical protein